MAVPNTKQLQHAEAAAEYFFWHLAEEKTRAVLLATSRGMGPWFAEQEKVADSAANRIDPETASGSEGFDAFMDEVNIFWDQYWEQIGAFIIKEAFKHYEVFLEASAHEILVRQGSGLVQHDTDESWNFQICRKFYSEYLGIEILPQPIVNIKWIRDKLSHLEDIRTPEGEKMLSDHLKKLGLDGPPTPEEAAMELYHDDWTSIFGIRLTFTPVQTWRILDVLRGHVNALAPQFLTLYWPQDGSVPRQLINLRSGQAVNPRKSNNKPGDSSFLRIPEPPPAAVPRSE